MANEYVDLDELKATLSLQGDDFADDDIELQLETASRDIDALCQQRFFVGGEEDRFFAARPWGWDVAIFPLVSLSHLYVDSDLDGTFATEWTVDVDFLLEPWNAVADGKPWRRVELRKNSGNLFPDTRPNVKITGVFGWVDTPAQIRTATSMLATRYLRRTRDAPFAIVPGESSSTRILRTDPDIYNLLYNAGFLPAPLQG